MASLGCLEFTLSLETASDPRGRICYHSVFQAWPQAVEGGKQLIESAPWTLWPGFQVWGL